MAQMLIRIDEKMDDALKRRAMMRTHLLEMMGYG